MSTTTQAARYSADHIDTGSDDEACSRCEGDGCSHCHGRGLVPAVSAPTDEQSRATPRIGDRFTLAAHGTRVVVAMGKPRWVAGGRVVTVAWEADNAAMRLPDGTVHPAHRAGFSWEEPVANLRRAATAPCYDCDGRGYDCERWPDGTERADATPVACTTCDGAGTLPLPLSIVMLLARRAA